MRSLYFMICSLLQHYSLSDVSANLSQSRQHFLLAFSINHPSFQTSCIQILILQWLTFFNFYVNKKWRQSLNVELTLNESEARRPADSRPEAWGCSLILISPHLIIAPQTKTASADQENVYLVHGKPERSRIIRYFVIFSLDILLTNFPLIFLE